ncbi:asparagine synthase (glutamine-hydrolyzing) [Magnetospirillum sp. UT-4]|uniref:asparagine synthase (glutamine-hydrolyzing) n=1 Tax=Magnetospirillum sp. UT-4 TaxID=2681467 RepID=UPI00137D8A18|nr:asparagine synthase (glutamine-hydrolyzing) [Magnetospirillum sp. UT-4]CAA7612097.1 Asparagine synthetase [Magnetospirillum sp. UT-4]
MCGIAGFIGGRTDRLREDGAAMIATLAHRGPDGDGLWLDPEVPACLGHRRLAVVDLSPAGRQPMASASGRSVIVYNGEVYNADELRRALEAAGLAFRGHSDTEVVVEACEAWGIDKTLERLNGMFAFALWDRAERCLRLARDRLGIKPLYWSGGEDGLAFASELKALQARSGWHAEIDRSAVASFLRFGYVPAPGTIWSGIAKLEPATVLSWRPGARPVIRRYWDATECAAAAPAAMSAPEAVAALDALLRDAVARQMVADVPLGAFLSGGIDSSTVAALMQAQSGRRVRTFSIGFREAAYDESEHAAAVARHLGTDHTRLMVEPGHALEVIPELPRWYDEPFGDSSQIPTALLSRMTRAHVTVALSGDGGDELFAGYTRYAVARRFGPALVAVPRPLRAAAAGLVRMVPPSAWDRLAAPVPARWRPAHPGDRLYKLADVLTVRRPEDFYKRLVSHWHDPAAVVIGAGAEAPGKLDQPGLARRIPDFVTRMQLADLSSYLPDDILTKVDRASMAFSLEARVPLLDHRVVEFALGLPLGQRIRAGRGKWLLRRVLSRYVPDALVERPKMGFGVPIGAWLKGPLRDWAESLLDESRLRHEGFLDPAPIRARWRQHLAGTANWQYPLWDVLMFQAWLEAQRTYQ